MCACINRFGTEKKKSCFFWGMSLRQQYLNELKKIFTNFLLGTFFLKLQLLLYMKMQKTQNFGVRTKKKNYFTFGPKTP